ncbi:MAG: tRNA (N6-threonylcarbamoyladenosine(37)-N6)-methyltransferase TrmO [Chloroflexi bacterium]|nr:tRNA (N6-threonylcarbamoyladenosine(37)-N6)-methyltransferase TrmO [Chloroflexota bacterium]
MNPIALRPIGTIHSPYNNVAGMPIQPAGAKGVRGMIKMLPEYVPGLLDLDGFSHLILIYHFHRVEGYALEIRPFLDKCMHGLFATRAPRRPNPIGLSIVGLESINGAVLHISDVDIMDNTPLLDIKPYVPAFDFRSEAKIGWLTGKVGEVTQFKSDNRFNE